MGRIAGIWAKRDGGEGTASVWTRLGLEHGLAGRVKAGQQFGAEGLV